MKLLDSSIAALMLGAAQIVARPAAAQVELHGFVEAATGIRATATSADDFSLEEVRAQIQLSDYHDKGEFFSSIDLVRDAASSTPGALEIREAWLKLQAFDDRLELKAGRQALNWGTGDLLFANDLFAKDWNAFFIGREDPYLKVPTDAFRLTLHRLPVGIDLVYTPRFNADVLPDPRRLPVDFPAPEGMTVLAPEVPGGSLEEGELALRLHRRLGSGTLSLYAYQGYTKTPDALRMEASTLTPYHAELRAFGSSLRRALAGGVFWLEGALRDISDNSSGDDPLLPGGRIDAIAGYQRSFGGGASWELQVYHAWQLDHDSLLEAARTLGTPEPPGDRQLVTLRLEKRLYYDSVRLSLFGLHSPADADGHWRPLVAYDHTDEIQLALGANLFYGDPGTLFGDLDRGDNFYLRARYRF